MTISMKARVSYMVLWISACIEKCVDELQVGKNACTKPTQMKTDNQCWIVCQFQINVKLSEIESLKGDA